MQLGRLSQLIRTVSIKLEWPKKGKNKGFHASKTFFEFGRLHQVLGQPSWPKEKYRIIFWPYTVIPYFLALTHILGHSIQLVGFSFVSSDRVSD